MNPSYIAAPVVIAAAITAYGATFPRSELFGRIISRTNSPRKLAITFDDGPNPAITPQILKLLERHQTLATFFVIGRFARECPALLRDIADRGHAIGNHTQNHVNLFFHTPSSIRTEIQSCDDSISDITGTRPKWFRPPWGARNPWVIPAARISGHSTVMWTLLPGDWRGKPADWLIRRMQPIANHAQLLHASRGNSSPGTGDILCLHDGDHRFLNADRNSTLAALTHWLPRWRDLGLEFVTIDDAVSTPANTHG